jgi:hypothetical protein
MKSILTSFFILHLILMYMPLSSVSAEDIMPVSPLEGNQLATVKIFSSKENAERFSETLKSKGFDVEVSEVTTKDKETMYRVSGKKHPESLKDALSSRGVKEDKKHSPDTTSEPSKERRRALVIISPRDRAEFRNVDKVTFSWLSVPQAAEYHVILAKDRDLQNIIIEATHITGTSDTIEGLDYGTYFFKIRSRLSDNTEGPSSEILSFVIVPPQPSTDPLYFLESDSS